MGTYTAIYGKVTLKKTVLDKVFQGDHFDWRKLTGIRVLRRHPDIINFMQCDRYDHIGNGGSSYFDPNDVGPSPWEKMKQGVAELPHFNVRDGSIVFHSSLKDYDHEIEKFFSILPLIADDWELFQEYEDDSYDDERWPNTATPYRYYGEARGFALSGCINVNKTGLKLANLCRIGDRKERSYDSLVSWG